MLLLQHLSIALGEVPATHFLALSAMHDQHVSWGTNCRDLAYFEQQMTLSVLQRRHGLDPSHLVFFIRQRSQALRTRFRMPSELSCLDVPFGDSDRWLEVGDTGDIELQG